MNIVLIFNGLGNQMSQYAFYLAKKSIDPKCQVMFDPISKNNHNGSELDKIFGIKYPCNPRIVIAKICLQINRSKKLRSLGLGIIPKLFGFRVIKEASNYDFNPELLKKREDGLNFYWGGWHSEKNFLSVKNQVRKIFTFNDEVDDVEFNAIKNDINISSNSVSLHVRRGDYLTEPKDSFYQYNGVATLYYYKQAIKTILEKYPDSKFFVFSNDIAWCKEQFLGDKFTFVTCNSGQNSWRDMYLMSLCKHHIIANSTFSWWGAWLSQDEGITIRPERFLRTVVTKDFYPDNWMILPSMDSDVKSVD